MLFSPRVCIQRLQREGEGWKKKTREEREREGSKHEEMERGVQVQSFLFSKYRTQSDTLGAREYKCPPSRLYNHGSVKLTSQSCS